MQKQRPARAPEMLWFRKMQCSLACMGSMAGALLRKGPPESSTNKFIKLERPDLWPTEVNRKTPIGFAGGWRARMTFELGPCRKRTQRKAPSVSKAGRE